MIRRMSGLSICLAALPLVWGLSGCGGGGSTPKKISTPTPPPTTTTNTPTPAGEKPADTGGGAPVAAGAEGWGTIKGQVVLDGEVPETKLLVKKGDQNAKDPAVCAVQDLPSEEFVVNKESKGIKWVLVYIGGTPKVHPDLAKAEGTAELGQKFCAFKPRLLAMRLGQKLLVTSEDSIAHNTKMDSLRNPPDNPTVPPAPENGKSELAPKELMSAELRPFPVQCGIHPWMRANIAVIDHPYFAVTDENGNFEIKQVPAGAQNLVMWQEAIGWGEGKGKGKEITVKADDTTDLGKISLKLP